MLRSQQTNQNQYKTSQDNCGHTWVHDWWIFPLVSSTTLILGVKHRKCFKGIILETWDSLRPQPDEWEVEKWHHLLEVRREYIHCLVAKGRRVCVCPQSHWAHVCCESMAGFTSEHIEQRAWLSTANWDMSRTSPWMESTSWLVLNTYFWHCSHSSAPGKWITGNHITPWVHALISL